MTWEIRQGHVLTRLRELPDDSVHCVVTSPPYWGLRDYGTARWDGGSEGCDHVERDIRTGLGLAEWSAEHAAGGGHKAGQVDKITYRDVCGKCGARRVDEQIGLEVTPAEYVAKLVDVFREVRRVLRPDGVCWLNVGDSYNNRSVARPSSHQGGLGFENDSIARSWADQTKLGLSRLSLADGDLKEKDLVGVPWMLAFALRADGWYLRSDVIWSKPNPMPESITDRPTQAHEYVFLLTKGKRYFYDHVAVRESSPEKERRRGAGAKPVRVPTTRDVEKLSNGHNRTGYSAQRGEVPHGTGRNRRNVWEVAEELWPQFLRWLETQEIERPDVWTVATIPFVEAHFATFPVKLVEPCVLASSSPRVCGVCGAPWERVIEATGAVNQRERADVGDWIREKGGNADGKRSLSGATYRHQRRGTDRFEPSCEHADDTGRALVLDPFAGSGTVGVVCEWHGRDFLGIELSSEYAEMARRRIAAEGPLGRAASRPRAQPAEHLSLFDH